MKKLLLFFLLFMAGCGQPLPERRTNVLFSLKIPVETEIEKILRDFPEAARHYAPLFQASEKFCDTLISPLNKYLLPSKQALNMGVYGADMAYMTLYYQDTLISRYARHVRKMAANLGVASLVDERKITLLRFHLTDSIGPFGFRTLVSMEKKMQQQKRPHLAYLMLAGGWIETLYLLGKSYRYKPDTVLLQRIGEHKRAAEHLVNALKQFKDQKECQQLLREVNILQQLFANVTVDIIPPKPPYESPIRGAMVMTLDKPTIEVKISPHDAIRIIDQVIDVRERITAPDLQAATQN